MMEASTAAEKIHRASWHGPQQADKPAAGDFVSLPISSAGLRQASPNPWWMARKGSAKGLGDAISDVDIHHRANAVLKKLARRRIGSIPDNSDPRSTPA
ncbi:hypothetical protein [Pseudomonas sp. PH1b]|uniref:hypothetical protein n=1 Tax=Pseudomonas sp. PH1b TaxID=1397282 RepID=UPI0012FEB5C1|nr:hypothetical protein [Pseudomonas sp. PH1b]BFD41194.1 hypothetical protein FFPRI1PSEUD_26930 [Pseudomonas sp. FFPRI_1]